MLISRVNVFLRVRILGLLLIIFFVMKNLLRLWLLIGCSLGCCGEFLSCVVFLWFGVWF